MMRHVTLDFTEEEYKLIRARCYNEGRFLCRVLTQVLLEWARQDKKLLEVPTERPRAKPTYKK